MRAGGGGGEGAREGYARGGAGGEGCEGCRGGREEGCVEEAGEAEGAVERVEGGGDERDVEGVPGRFGGVVADWWWGLLVYES